MRLCYACGDFIKGRAVRGYSSLCPNCKVCYCDRCSLNTHTCYTCGTKPVRDVTPNEQTHTLEDVIADMYSDASYTEKRRHPRKTMNTIIEYFINQEGHARQNDGVVKGLSMDVSDSGLCMNTKVPLRKGQELFILKSPLNGSPALATVRWVKRIDTDTYTAGLVFKTARLVSDHIPRAMHAV